MATKKNIQSEADIIANQKAEIERLSAELEARQQGSNVMVIRANPESAGDLIFTDEHPERADTMELSKGENLRREVAREKLYGIDPAHQHAIAKAIDAEEAEEAQEVQGESK